MAQTTETRRVLVTGAAGHIGSYFAENSSEKYALRLMVRGDEERIDSLRQFGELVEADLADLDRLKQIFAGMDTVLHLAGNAGGSALWKDLLEANIAGTYNVFAAAKTAGVRRVVYASSIHAVSGYAPDVQVKTTEPVNPADLYGVSKCFGEALARYMAEREGVSAVAVRIGAFQPTGVVQNKSGAAFLDDFVSQRDLNQLLERCIDAEDVQFAIVHGISDNRFKRLDLSDTRARLGYAPQDDAAEQMPALRDLHLRDHIDPAVGVTPESSGLRGDVG